MGGSIIGGSTVLLYSYYLFIIILSVRRQHAHVYTIWEKLLSGFSYIANYTCRYTILCEQLSLFGK